MNDLCIYQKWSIYASTEKQNLYGLICWREGRCISSCASKQINKLEGNYVNHHLGLEDVLQGGALNIILYLRWFEILFPLSPHVRLLDGLFVGLFSEFSKKA